MYNEITDNISNPNFGNSHFAPVPDIIKTPVWDGLSPEKERELVTRVQITPPTKPKETPKKSNVNPTKPEATAPKKVVFQDDKKEDVKTDKQPKPTNQTPRWKDVETRSGKGGGISLADLTTEKTTVQTYTDKYKKPLLWLGVGLSIYLVYKTVKNN